MIVYEKLNLVCKKEYTAIAYEKFNLVYKKEYDAIVYKKLLNCFMNRSTYVAIAMRYKCKFLPQSTGCRLSKIHLGEHNKPTF